MIASASARSTLVHPPVYGFSGTTTGPGAVGGPMWMCAAVMGSTPLTVMVQQTWPSPGLIRSVAVPTPSGSPWFGTPSALTSAAPVSVVVNGRPPSAATADAAPAPMTATAD